MAIPLCVWVTRPSASEVYMGGDRRLDLWLELPCYLHSPFETDRKWPSGRPRMRDRGWGSAGTHIYAKPLIEQDDDLRSVIWDHVAWSCAPRGMTLMESREWASQTLAEPDPDGKGSPVWRNLFSDRQWEAKCNVSQKRFLLKVDLRANAVERIIPSWMGRGNTAKNDAGNWVTSDSIEDSLAVEYYHPEEDQTSPV